MFNYKLSGDDLISVQLLIFVVNYTDKTFQEVCG